MLAAHGVSLESIAESLLFENLSNEKKPFFPSLCLPRRGIAGAD